ncbi:MAG: glucosamine-6-phosphate deaminase [Acidobacteria bacterium]|nr:glucosamine-6-phosphate deaminase [Acidobacteriota bacterium]
MKILVFDDAPAVGLRLGSYLADIVAARAELVLGLPTGRTPLPLYAALRQITTTRGLSWAGVRTFNLDEFVGVAPDAPGSYRAYMQRELFGPVGIPADHVGFLDGTAADLDAECRRYEAAIAAAGGMDVLVLGIGTNGHIGFNEPAPALHARTHRAALQAATRASNAGQFGGDVTCVPAEALSMGMATILEAKEILLMATGAGKAPVVRQLRDGGITTALPASFLQLHGNVSLWLDAAAADV